MYIQKTIWKEITPLRKLDCKNTRTIYYRTIFYTRITL